MEKGGGEVGGNARSLFSMDETSSTAISSMSFSNPFVGALSARVGRQGASGIPSNSDDKEETILTERLVVGGGGSGGERVRAGGRGGGGVGDCGGKYAV